MGLLSCVCGVKITHAGRRGRGRSGSFRKYEKTVNFCKYFSAGSYVRAGTLGRGCAAMRGQPHQDGPRRAGELGGGSYPCPPRRALERPRRPRPCPPTIQAQAAASMEGVALAGRRYFPFNFPFSDNLAVDSIRRKPLKLLRFGNYANGNIHRKTTRT